jgi:hypothetical protein
MRWRVESKKRQARPQDGALRYRIKFAWTPVRTTLGNGIGFASWPEEMIWLEKVIDVQRYCSRGFGDWEHGWWYPINEFTTSLYEHNNQ